MMTKKEKAAMDAAILKAETLAALRWTEPTERDVAPPTVGDQRDKVSKGWDFNAYTKKVEPYSCSSIYSWTGHTDIPVFTASRGSLVLFSSELLALKALRHAVELKSAEELRLIDKRIEQAKEIVG